MIATHNYTYKSLLEDIMADITHTIMQSTQAAYSSDNIPDTKFHQSVILDQENQLPVT